MPVIKAFRGIRYDPSRVNMELVLAPPYDVISMERREQLYSLDPRNVVRLILSREQDPYSDAAGLLKKWMDERILLEDPRDACYVLAQTFHDGFGATITRRGFIAACRLEEFGKGKILPHEKTLPGPKADRLRLFQATGMMFSQVFGLYSDPKGALNALCSSIMETPPLVDVMFEGIRTRFWKTEDRSGIASLGEFLKDREVLIADGHHRYETALAYRDFIRNRRGGQSGQGGHDFLPMFLTNMYDPGLAILPTHRLVRNLEKFDKDHFLAQLRTSFALRPCGDRYELLRLLRETPPHAFGLSFGEPGVFYLIRAEGMPGLPSEDVLASLEVTVLHDRIINGILGLSPEDQTGKKYLIFQHDSDKALDSVANGESQIAFLMNPTRIEEVRKVASAGLVMPQKSTFFFPKLPSGLVFYSFSPGATT